MVEKPLEHFATLAGHGVYQRTGKETGGLTVPELGRLLEAPLKHIEESRVLLR
jgi:hypothetical protein